MLEKLKFWKHEEFQPLPEQPGPDALARQDPMQDPSFLAQDPNTTDPYAQLRTPTYPQSQPFPGSAAQPQAFTPYAEPQQHQPRDRDTELILAKLDAIKSDLDALNQRLRTVEASVAPKGQQPQQRYW